MVNRPTNSQLRRLVNQIKQNQANITLAEKRVKIDTTFNKAIKKNGANPTA